MTVTCLSAFVIIKVAQVIKTAHRDTTTQTRTPDQTGNVLSRPRYAIAAIACYGSVFLRSSSSRSRSSANSNSWKTLRGTVGLTKLRYAQGCWFWFILSCSGISTTV